MYVCNLMLSWVSADALFGGVMANSCKPKIFLKRFFKKILVQIFEKLNIKLIHGMGLGCKTNS